MTLPNQKYQIESRGPSPFLGLLLMAFVSAIAGCAVLSSATVEPPTSASSAEGWLAFAATPPAAAAEPSAFIAPILGSALDPTPGPTPLPTVGPPLPPPTVVVALPPIDLEAARAKAQAQGLDLAFTKIGFHTGPGGNATGLGQWMADLNAAGIPFFLKSTDDAGPILEAQNIMKANEAAGRFVPHTLVFRLTDPRFEAPFYNLSLSPEEAAAVSWQLNRDNVPSDLEKEYIWLETLNEPGRYGDNGQLQIERLGRFSLETAKLALTDGYRYGAFSWSTGVPEPEDWEHPAMLDFLRFAGEHPDEVAVAIHEYSLTNDHIGAIYPYLVGRFQSLFDICDRHGIPRPTILITEWGWEYNSVPQPIPAVEDMAWASWLYAAYPQVKGAAVWYLGGQFGGIAQKAQQLILPMRDYARSHYFIIDPGTGRIDAELFRPNPPTLLGVDPLTMPTPFPRPRTMP